MRYYFILLFVCSIFFPSCVPKNRERKIFDVHLHGDKNIVGQLEALEHAGIQNAAISTSWSLQNSYRGKTRIKLLYGLMVPCPNGKVPYSQQPCFEDGKEWPDINWVEQQIKENKIDFLGEVLSQYYGISSSDTLLFPYYALAEKYDLPVGIHTGSAGPHHGAPNFKEEMGTPFLLKPVLLRFPKLKVWIMHAGGSFLKETIAVMKEFPQVYTDISVINNPGIVPPEQFRIFMKTLINAGLEDRMMFGSDNAEIKTVIAAVDQLDFLTTKQKEKIFYRNAEIFFKP